MNKKAEIEIEIWDDPDPSYYEHHEGISCYFKEESIIIKGDSVLEILDLSRHAISTMEIIKNNKVRIEVKYYNGADKEAYEENIKTYTHFKDKINSIENDIAREISQNSCSWEFNFKEGDLEDCDDH